MKIFFVFIQALICLALASCSSVTGQSRKNMVMDASAKDNLGGTGTDSEDIRSMAERMARELLSLNLSKKSVNPIIALGAFNNETRFAINTNIIKDRLLNDLISITMNKGLSFSRKVENATYILDARITALSKGSKDAVSDYILYSFSLIDQNESIIWMGSYETKKQSSMGVMYR